MAHGWRSNWPLTAALIWTIALIGIGVQAYLKPRGRTVFDIYRIAGQQWWHNGDLYPRQVETREFFRYSPTFAVASSPFVVLPPGAGNAAWKMANGAFLAICVWIWCRRGLLLSRNQSAAVLLLCIPASIQSLHIGQANLLMTGFVLIGLTAAAREQWWHSAAFIAAATLIKVFPLALAMLLTVLYWRTFSWRFLIALTLGLVLPFASLRFDYTWRQTKAWFEHLVWSNELNPERLRSFGKLCEVLGVPIESHHFLLLGAAAGAVVLVVGLWTVRRGADRRVVLLRVGAWFLTWAVLFVPSSENPTFAILAPVVSLAIVDAFGRRGAWLERVWLIVVLYLIALATTDAGGPLKSYAHNHCATTVGALMFQAWLVLDLFRGVHRPIAVAANHLESPRECSTD